MAGKVVIRHAMVHELEDGDVFIHGYVDSSSLPALQVDDYQREVLVQKKNFQELVEAHTAGERVNDINLNIRGRRFKLHDDGSVEIQDDVFIVDGQQRVRSKELAMKNGAPSEPLIGVSIAVNQTYEWEKRQFDLLNFHRTQLSANIKLRNLADTNPAMRILLRYTENRSRPLLKRVTWDQGAKPTHLMSAPTLVKIVARLHSHWGPGKASGSDELAANLLQIIDKVGEASFKANVEEFFDVFEECWELSKIERKGATILSHNFMLILADVFADYTYFWEGTRLKIAPPVRKQLAGINPSSESVRIHAFGRDKDARHMMRRTFTEQITRRWMSSDLETWAEAERRAAE
ncbi:MAG: hypothetical protein JWS12_607 [Candidatus Saccharibacteria bacterium]|nr:hypothetical protein [Candidatus Saccharibacteria bacterium]